MFNIEVWFYLLIFLFAKKKNFKAYYGFRVLYVFPFPSVGHWPFVQVVTKLVSEQWFHCWFLNCCFVFFLHYCGIRLSNVGSVIIASSILRSICSIIVFWFYLVVFPEWKVKHEMLLLLEQLIMLSSPFKVKLLLLLLDVEEEVAVVEECCLMLYMFGCDFYEWNCWFDYVLLWLPEMSKTRSWVFIRGW